jgi:hypothetical protein
LNSPPDEGLSAVSQSISLTKLQKIKFLGEFFEGFSMTLLHQNAVPVSLPTCDRCFFHWKDLTNSASGLCCKNLLRTENSLEEEVIYATTPAYLVDEFDPFSDDSFSNSLDLSLSHHIHNLVSF